jgi:hypothetical protein
MRVAILLLFLLPLFQLGDLNAQEYGTEVGVFLVDDFVSHLDRPIGLGVGLQVKRLIGVASKSPTVTGVYVMTAQSPESFPLIQNRGFQLRDAVQRYLEIGFLFGKYLYLNNGMTIEGNAIGAVRLGQSYTGEERLLLSSGQTLTTLRTERVSEVLLEYGIDLRVDYPTNPAKDQGLSLVFRQNLRSLAGEADYESPLFGIGYYWRPAQQSDSP